MSTWTAEDEAQFQALFARREQVRGAQIAKLETVAGYICNKMQAQVPASSKEKALTNAMMQHADELIDAILPFDSGTRPAA